MISVIVILPLHLFVLTFIYIVYEFDLVFTSNTLKSQISIQSSI